ncbi:DUF4405 domain-containing protein [Candidatus Woesearchaeota archaeon]|nr:DUF4405 domain-containing protein [Candidatus Woesearchaeota archaeon]
MNKATKLYIVDMILAISFILAGITGVIKMPGWFNIKPEILKPLMIIHDWSGIAMVALVLVHLIQHWKWIVAMTKRLIIQNEQVKNIFIIIGVMIITSILALSAYSLTSKISNNNQENSISNTISEENTHFEEPQHKNIKTGGCPYGVEDDPYPGLCGLYKDRNENGLCDYGE